MFCEKCGTQIPDGGDNLCPRCRAAEAPVQSVQPVLQPVQAQIPQPVQSVPQPVQPQQTVQPQQPAQTQFQQPMMQQPMAKVGGLNDILANPMIVMIAKLVMSCFAVWAGFGPLLAYVFVGASFMGQSMGETGSLLSATEGGGEVIGYRVVSIIFMILALVLALAGAAISLLPKIAPNVKLPLPSCASYAAIVGSLLCSIINEFVTIGFCGYTKGVMQEQSGGFASGLINVSLSGFGVFMMIMSFIFIAASVLLSFIELKKK